MTTPITLGSIASLHNTGTLQCFFRANARRVGLVYRPEPLHATYVAAIENGEIVGVVALGWNGMLMVQSPEGVEDLARACVEKTGRKATGFIGPLEQVRRARTALGLADAPAKIATDEWLYGLDLKDLVIPASLQDGSVVCRAPLPDECPTLYQWRHDYDVETLGGTPSEETLKRATMYLDAQIAGGNAWVAIEGGQSVSLAAFNALLPDIVQLGGIYTPPALRGRSYAKAVVAASLIAARDRGASRAILFTPNPNAARTYEALGFRRLREDGVILMR